jgi:hypothetical protein
MTASKSSAQLARVLAELRRYGLLLKQDKGRPSVVGLVTGEVLTGSWWSHPQAKEIFDLLEALSERADVLETKLLGGKVTFVFESLWPAWLGVATCAEAWQTAGLSNAAQTLLAEVSRVGELDASGAAVKELELRLLVPRAGARKLGQLGEKAGSCRAAERRGSGRVGARCGGTRGPATLGSVARAGRSRPRCSKVKYQFVLHFGRDKVRARLEHGSRRGRGRRCSNVSAS